MSPSVPPSAADPWLGRVVGGRWRIVSLLDDSGGMASVYLADDQTLSRKAVVKIPRSADLNSELRERFAREAFWHAQVENLHVVHVLDRGEEAGTPFLVLQYLPGGNLKAWCERNPSILADPRLHHDSWLLPIAQALDAVATKGIVHRDVKPSNILFDAAGAGYLSDFGIVKAADEATMTRTDMVVGTAHFMSPEQYHTDLHEALDGRSDQYGLAVTVYQVLTGWKYPVTASTLGPIVAAKFGHAPLTRPIEHEPRVPRAVDDAVMRALAHDREQRFASCVEFARAVRDGFTSRAEAPPRPKPPVTADRPPPPPPDPPRRPLAGIVGGLAVAAVAAGIGIATWRSWSLRPMDAAAVPPARPPSTGRAAAAAPGSAAARESAIDTRPFDRLVDLAQPEVVESWLDELERNHPSSLAPAALRVRYLAVYASDDDPDAKRRAKILAEGTLRRHPDDPWANLAMAIVLRDEKRTAEALEKVDVAIEGLNGRPDAEVQKVWMLTEDTGRQAEGMALARDLVVRFPNDARVHNALGTRLFNTGDFATGLVSVRRACDLAPDVAVYWNNLGFGLIYLERFDDAVEAYDRAIAAAPRNSRFHLGKANASESAGREDEALACIDDAIRIAPRDPDVHAAKAGWLERRGRLREAVDALSQGLAARPDLLQLLAARAELHLRLDEPAAALEDATRIQRQTGDVAQYGALMAIAQAKLDRWPDALATATRLIDAAEGNAALTYAYTLRIEIYRHLGREEDAKNDEAVLARISGATSQ